MFDSSPTPLEVRLAVASRRDGWHPCADHGAGPSGAHGGARATADAARERLLRLDVEALGADEALSVLVAVQAQRAALDALEARLMVRAAGAVRVVREVLVEHDPMDDLIADRSVGESRGRRLQMVDEVVHEIAAALRRPHGTVRVQVQQARLLAGPLQRTRAELAAGRIAADHARVLCEQAGRMMQRDLGEDTRVDAAFADVCDQLQDRVLPTAVAGTAAQTRDRARRCVDVIDQAAARARRRRARGQVDVRCWAEDDGLAVLMARLPALDAALLMGRVDAMVRADSSALAAGIAEATGDADPTLGQLRAAALMRLMAVDGVACDAATLPGARVEVQVVVDAATLVGRTPDAPAWVQIGTGAPAAVDRDDLVALIRAAAGAPASSTAGSPSGSLLAGLPVEFRRMLVDPLTGHLLDRGARTYRPSAALAAWVAARDVTCRFPGCTLRAVSVRADVDHAMDHADGGLTSRANLGMLCRRHHNAKTHSGWRISDARADGSCTFTSPSGRTYRHEPVRLLPEPRAPEPGAPEPGAPEPSPPDDDPLPF